MGSRTDDLTIRVGQKPEFDLISFRPPSGAKYGGRTWRMSTVRSYQYLSPRSFLRISKEDVVGGRCSLVFCRKSRHAVSHRRWVLTCPFLRVRDVALVLRCLCRQERRDCILWELKVRWRFHHRRWCDSSGCPRSRQTEYLSVSCLVRHPPYVRESSCLKLRLPSRRDMTAEPEASDQRGRWLSLFLICFTVYSMWLFTPSMYIEVVVPVIEAVAPVIEAPVYLL